MAQDYGVQRGRNDWDNVGDGYAKEARPADVLDGGESEGDTAGYLDDYYGFGSGEELSEAIRGGALVLDDDGNLIQLLDDEVQEQRRDYKNQEESFSKDIDVWNRESSPPKAIFLLGSTGEAPHLDKKRTTRLLSAIGFYMPITCDRSGYIGSISYNGENVNIRGAKFSDVISESFDLEQEQRRDYQKYSYEWFVSKPDMPMTIIGVNSYNNQKEVVHQAKVNAAASGSVNPKDGSVSIYVDDIGTDIVLGTKGLRHGLDRRFNLLAPITVKAGEIIKNSILINEITPKDNGSTECYALIGIAKATDGEIYIVRSIVNRYGNELASMDVLYAINAKNAKKEPAGRLSPQGGQHESSNPSGSKVSIASLLSIVNRHFPDVLSEV